MLKFTHIGQHKTVNIDAIFRLNLTFTACNPPNCFKQQNHKFLLLTPCIKHSPDGLWPQGQLWSPQVLVWYHTLIFTRHIHYAAYTMPSKIRSQIPMCLDKYFAYKLRLISVV